MKTALFAVVSIGCFALFAACGGDSGTSVLDADGGSDVLNDSIGDGVENDDVADVSQGDPDSGTEPDATDVDERDSDAGVPDADAGEPDADAGDATADDVAVPDAADAGDDALACSPPASSGALDVRTGSATYRGEVANGARRWLGMRFAAAPTGALRWQPPEAPPCEAEVIDALSFAPKCMQRIVDGELEGEEDCLAVNVWTPDAEPPEEGWPVLVFIHGGGNAIGSARQLVADAAPSSLIYDGRFLAAAEEVVVVTLQYRLGVLGYLAHPALARADGGIGNFGILDQIAALRWVEENIGAFGGNADRVLLFGESAGGVNTCVHVASPLSGGLFDVAVMQSAACTAETREQAEGKAIARVEQTDCADSSDVASCLRALDGEVLLEQVPGSVQIGRTTIGPDPNSFGPVIDGVVLSGLPLTVIAANEHNAVPFVVGSNAEEVAGYVPPTVTTELQFENAVRALVAPVAFFVPTAADDLLAVYDLADYASPQAAWEAVLGDMRFTCTGRRAAVVSAEAGLAPVYRYFFSRRAATRTGSTPARHGAELLYVFGSIRNIPLFAPDSVDLGLSDTMMNAWANLARALEPGSVDGVVWGELEGSDPTMVFGDGVSLETGVREAECDVWDVLTEAVTP